MLIALITPVLFWAYFPTTILFSLLLFVRFGLLSNLWWKRGKVYLRCYLHKNAAFEIMGKHTLVSVVLTQKGEAEGNQTERIKGVLNWL